MRGISVGFVAPARRVRSSRRAVPFRPASSGPVRYWQDRARLAVKGAIAAVAACAASVPGDLQCPEDAADRGGADPVGEWPWVGAAQQGDLVPQHQQVDFGTRQVAAPALLTA
jgi:hypothetical protein